MENKIEYLDKLPNPGVLGETMTERAKKIYRHFGKLLLATGRLSKLDLGNLVQLAVAWEKFLWAEKQMAEKNNVDFGSGYVQTFKSGATNITTEFSISEKAQDQILKLSKLFGLSMKDRHGMLEYLDKKDFNQTSLWDDLQDDETLKVVG